MRLWSLHPRYLDRQGLLALWREGLLAQKVLQGVTKGYRNHPQLLRFKEQVDPVAAIAAYLRQVADEAACRGYRFDCTKLALADFVGTITVTSGQLDYERSHLLAKLQVRDQARYAELLTIAVPTPHPLFREVAGGVEPWEVITVRL